MWACTDGCTLIYQGHSLDENVVKSIQPGVTTEEGLLRLLGSPDAITKKLLEGITVYQKNMSASFRLEFRFPYQLARDTKRPRP